SPPAIASIVATELNGLIHLGVRVRFVLAFIPSKSAVEPEPARHLLLHVDSEPVLYLRLRGMIRNLRPGCLPGEGIIDRIPIDTHIGVIHKREQPDYTAAHR